MKTEDERQTKKGLAIIEHMLAGEHRRQRSASALRDAIAEQVQLGQAQLERDVAAVEPTARIVWTGPVTFELVQVSQSRPSTT